MGFFRVQGLGCYGLFGGIFVVGILLGGGGTLSFDLYPQGQFVLTILLSDAMSRRGCMGIWGLM